MLTRQGKYESIVSLGRSVLSKQAHVEHDYVDFLGFPIHVSSPTTVNSDVYQFVTWYVGFWTIG